MKFSNHGHYFVSCGHDKTVKLWTTEQSSCLRIFVGHFSDVDCIAFQPVHHIQLKKPMSLTNSGFLQYKSSYLK